MKGSMNKGFFSYLMLFLILALAAIFVCGAIMMYSPGTPILGYVFVKGDSKTIILDYNGFEAEKYKGFETTIKDAAGNEINPFNNPTLVNFTALSKLVVKTNGMKVNVIRTKDNERIDVIKDFKGFSKADDVKPYKLTKQYDSANKIFTLIVEDYNPQLKLINNNKINIYVMAQTANNLEIETVSSSVSVATISYDSYTPRDLAFKSISVKTETGNITLSDKVTVQENLNIQVLKKSNVNINSNVQKGEGVLTSNVSFDIKEGNLTTKNIVATNLLLKSEEMLFVKTGNITAAVTLKIKNGDFVVGNITGNVVDPDDSVENLDFTAKNIDGSLTIPKAKDGDFIIDSVKGILTINKDAGLIKVKDTSNSVIITTKSGDVYLSNKTQSENEEEFFYVNITTEKGDINFLMGEGKTNNVNLTSSKGSIKAIYHTNIVDMTVTVTAKKVNFANENKTLSDVENLKGYPTTTAQPKTTSIALNITTEGEVKIDAKATLAWNLIA